MNRSLIRPSPGVTAHHAPARRGGFSLAEILVAITIFAVTMSALAVLTMSVSRQSVDGWGSARRTAAVTARINDIAAVPFDGLDARAGCTSITDPPFPRTECIAVSNITTTRKRVGVTITPQDTAYDPKYVEMERTKPPALNPFNAIK